MLNQIVYLSSTASPSDSTQFANPAQPNPTTTNPLDPSRPQQPPFSSPGGNTLTGQQTATKLSTLTAPHTSLHDSRITQPWFGPNAWTVALQPTPGGGIPPNLPGVLARFTFKEGGVFEWHARYCELRERLAQMRENRSGGDATAQGGEAEVEHLEQLPAYEAVDTRRRRADSAQSGAQAQQRAPVPRPEQVQPTQRPPVNIMDEPIEEANPASQYSPATTDQTAPAPARPAAPAPDEAPPGYEESQSQQQDAMVDRMDTLGVQRQGSNG